MAGNGAAGEREGGLEAPTRHPIPWQEESFYDEQALNAELERVFDICHGCRRCVSLCESFPTLFDLIDESATFDVSGVEPASYSKVSEQCYLCDLCYQTKCPYVPPHEWQVDFPHLMLRAKALQFRKGRVPLRERLITATDRIGRLAARPVLAPIVNALLQNTLLRRILEPVLGIHRKARLLRYAARPLNAQLGRERKAPLAQPAPDPGPAPRMPPQPEPKPLRELLPETAPEREPMMKRVAPIPLLVTEESDPPPPPDTGPTRGKVVLFGSCYGRWSRPQLGEDLAAVMEHNGIPTRLLETEFCCGMPKMDLGDLDAVARLKALNMPPLRSAVDEGWDILSTVPSCVLMFRQELPLLFPEDEDVQEVARHIFDPFEYLHYRRRAGLLKTDFRHPIGKLAYQAACHQRVQNFGSRTRDILALVPDTEIEVIERCSGHDGTYAVRSSTYEKSMKILKPVLARVKKSGAETYTSDCPMAASHIAHGLGQAEEPPHPLSLLRQAYGI